MTELAWETLATPVGELSVACTEAGVARVRFGQPPGRAGRPGPGKAGLLGDALAQLGEYFAGRRRAFSVPVDWSAVSGTRHEVLSVLLDSVGYGTTITYGALAGRADVTDGGKAPPARVVGQIMGSNPYPVIVPCHRVVAGTGLGGYSGGAGIEIKRWLLTFEGAIPATLDWDPAGYASA
ncbi:MAG TPA: methylated-DNA--[protein]-cysteine S-methyltransferase [Streptosporangiaceae bacterium]